MYYPVELVMANYKPLRLEAGMLFLTKIHQGTIKELVEIWALNVVHTHRDEFFQEHGYPIKLLIVDDRGDIIAEDKEIGWWDDGPEIKELRDITLKDINIILNDYGGFLELDFKWKNKKKMKVPRFVMEKVILKLLTEEEE